MQGYFALFFEGIKEDTDKLINYLTEMKEEDDLHLFLFKCLAKDEDYDNKENNEKTSIDIDMSNIGGSGNIADLDIEQVVAELCEAVPELTLNGEYKLLDASNRQIFESEAGNSSFVEDETLICTSCAQELLDNDPVYMDEEGEFLCESCYQSAMAETIADEYGEDFDKLLELSIEELREKWPDAHKKLGLERAW